MGERERDALVARVRIFNRAVTQRVGALQDHYLARQRPLGEARLLWEVGGRGCDVRTLRARLGLDSGYTSRLLRSLEAARLLKVDASDRDARVRTARLTKKGMAERAVLDERSDALAWSMLEPLTPSERDRLVTAMTDVARLLTVGSLEIRVVDPADPAARYCLREYATELDDRFESGFDPAASLPLLPDEMRPPAGLFLVATLHDDPVGCGALKFHDGAPTELKRLWVSPVVRGLGVGRRLVDELERRAAEHGSRAVRLDTNKALAEAIALYRTAGYREIAAFNTEPYADHWFEKRLPRARTAMR